MERIFDAETAPCLPEPDQGEGIFDFRDLGDDGLLVTLLSGKGWRFGGLPMERNFSRIGEMIKRTREMKDCRGESEREEMGRVAQGEMGRENERGILE